MPMSDRIGVLTFHRCVNYGSYWQARALVEGLQRDGRDVVLLDHHSRSAERAEARNAFQPVRPVRTARSDYPALAAKARSFAQAISSLPLSRPFPLEEPEAMDRQDVVVVGSDEVWNLSHPWYAAKHAFFGDGLKAERVIAYAASFGCHDAIHALDACWAERLRRFQALSVRDENSLRILRLGLGRETPLALDPCLQYPQFCRRAGAAEKIALVYGHGFPPAFVAHVRDWARTRSLRLVSIGYRNDWADTQHLSAGPEDFAQAVGAARAVITTYFHGCVFALLNDKPFACTLTHYRRHKIDSLVQSLAAQDRLLCAEATQAELEQALDDPPSDETKRRIARLRAQSADFLDNALQ